MSEDLKDMLKDALREVLSELKEEVSDKPKVKRVQKKKKVVAKKKATKKKGGYKTPLQQLKDEAKELGIKGYSKMKKAELEEAINGRALDNVEEEAPNGWTFISDKDMNLDSHERKQLAKAKSLDKVSSKSAVNSFNQRPKVEKVKMVCRECEKEEMVVPAFARYPTADDKAEGITNVYICNRCSHRGRGQGLR